MCDGYIACYRWDPTVSIAPSNAFYSAGAAFRSPRACHLRYKNRPPYQLLTTKTNDATIAAPMYPLLSFAWDKYQAQMSALNSGR